MSVFVMSDLHLSTNTATNKSMEVFGKRWQDYTEKIRRGWTAVVGEDDTVVIPGDISWGMTLDEALPDFLFIESLPGQKLIGKGNHDFWWATNAKMSVFFREHHIDSVRILNNNAYRIGDRILCGTRGWFLEEKQQMTVGSVDYDRIVNRETIRLRLSLDEAVKLRREEENASGRTLPITVFLHFPPVFLDFICREFVDVLHEYGITDCCFGHIHGLYGVPRTTEFEGIRLTLASSDFLNFIPLPLSAAEEA